MEGRHCSLPGTQPGAPLFNLLDERVERLLPFRQMRLVMVGSNADGPEICLGHGMISAGWCENEHPAILTEVAFAPRWRPRCDSEHAHLVDPMMTCAGARAERGLGPRLGCFRRGCSELHSFGE